MTGGATRGACYGYAIRADRRLRYLRRGGGTALDVVTADDVGEDVTEPLLMEWAPPVFPFSARLYGDGRRFRLWVADTGWFLVEPHEGRITAPSSAGVRCEERIWGIPALLCFVARGDLPLHAAAVEVGSGAVLIAAPGRFGKTTLAAAFAAAGRRVLAEDLACVRSGNSAAVIPGPAMLRIRRDIADLLPSAGVEQWRDDDRVHVAVRNSGTCDPVPLRAVVLLRDAESAPHLTRCQSASVVPDLWALSFNLASHADRVRCFAGVTDLAARIPVYDLLRRRTIPDLKPTVELLVEAFGD